MKNVMFTIRILSVAVGCLLLSQLFSTGVKPVAVLATFVSAPLHGACAAVI